MQTTYLAVTAASISALNVAVNTQLGDGWNADYRIRNHLGR